MANEEETSNFSDVVLMAKVLKTKDGAFVQWSIFKDNTDYTDIYKKETIGIFMKNNEESRLGEVNSYMSYWKQKSVESCKQFT